MYIKPKKAEQNVSDVLMVVLAEKKKVVNTSRMNKMRKFIKERNKMSELKITKENFEEVVKKTEKPVLVDFWATWCGPCRMIAPVISQIAEEYEEEIVVGKVNVDEEGELAVVHNVVSIPTLLVFKNGEVVNKAVGFMSKEEVLELIK